MIDNAGSTIKKSNQAYLQNPRPNKRDSENSFCRLGLQNSRSISISLDSGQIINAQKIPKIILSILIISLMNL